MQRRQYRNVLRCLSGHGVTASAGSWRCFLRVPVNGVLSQSAEEAPASRLLSNPDFAVNAAGMGGPHGLS
jgi:hypothetical protein